VNRWLRAASLAVLIASPALAQVDEVLQEIGGRAAGWAADYQQTGCVLPVWHTDSTSRIFLVPQPYRPTGAREGDYITRVNGESVPQGSGQLQRALSGVPGDAEVSLTVYGDGEFRELRMQCLPAEPFAIAMGELAEGLQAADPAACLAAIDEFRALTGGTLSGGLLDIGLRCHNALNPGGPLDERAARLAELARARLQLAKYLPSELFMVQDGIRANIEVIRQMGFPEAAAELQRALDAAFDFVANDEPLPDIL